MIPWALWSGTIATTVTSEEVRSRVSPLEFGQRFRPARVSSFKKKINLLFGSDWCKVQNEAILVGLRRRDSPDLQHFFAQTK